MLCFEVVGVLEDLPAFWLRVCRALGVPPAAWHTVVANLKASAS